MTPYLKIADQITNVSTSVKLGATQALEIRFQAPTIEMPVIINSITAGEILAIATDLQGSSSSSSTNITNRLEEIASEVESNPDAPKISPTELQELLLSAIISSWFSEVEMVNQMFADISDVVSLRYPSLGMVFTELIPTNSAFGVPTEVTFAGVTMDIDRDLVVTLSKDGNPDASVSHTLLMGIIGSQLEANLPSQYLFHLDENPNAYWLATTSSLAIAQDLEDTLVALTPSNFPLVAPQLALPASELVDIEDAINAGMVVFLHQSLLVDRAGTKFLGYIQYDPLTGSGNWVRSQKRASENICPPWALAQGE